MGSGMSIRDQIIAEAAKRQGIPYGLPPGPGQLDCSLFVLEVAKASGAALPVGVRTAEQIRQATLPVAFRDVLPGDLLFFEGTYAITEPPGPDGHVASHIGISLGAGTQKMWDANSAHGVGLTDISTQFWQSAIFDARRLPQLAATAEPPKEAGLRGIDVASHQGAVAWQQVAASGVAFAITKATQGTGYLNPTFATNWLGIKSAGIIRGAYHYAEPAENGPDVEAKYFVDQVKRLGLEAGDLLALDYEPPGAKVEIAAAWMLGWMERVERATDVRPLLYTGSWVIDRDKLQGATDLAAYPLWLASYRDTMPAAPAPWTEIAVWQYSDRGSVPGITGDVDLNRFGGTRAQLLALGKPADVAFARPGDVGSGILALMAEDATEPAMPSTFLPLGRNPAQVEEALGLNGTRYLWHLATGRHWRYPAA